jgi:hypothetical protein
VIGGRSPLFTACIQMQETTRDFYEKRATELAAIAERSKSQDQRSDLLDLARAWHDLACAWETPVGRHSLDDRRPSAWAA